MLKTSIWWRSAIHDQVLNASLSNRIVSVQYTTTLPITRIIIDSFRKTIYHELESEYFDQRHLIWPLRLCSTVFLTWKSAYSIASIVNSRTYILFNAVSCRPDIYAPINGINLILIFKVLRIIYFVLHYRDL